MCLGFVSELIGKVYLCGQKAVELAGQVTFTAICHSLSFALPLLGPHSSTLFDTSLLLWHILVNTPLRRNVAPVLYICWWIDSSASPGTRLELSSC